MRKQTDTKPVLLPRTFIFKMKCLFAPVHFISGLFRSIFITQIRTFLSAAILALFLFLLLPLFFSTRVYTRAQHTGSATQANLTASTSVANSQTTATTKPTTQSSVRAFPSLSHLLGLLAPQTASALASDNLNFQARLQTASGAIVPDGYYNIQFNLYSASSGGTSLWTETYAYNSGSGSCTGPVGTNDCRVRVANGYVSVYLGSQTAFPGTMPWDQQLYLTMNVDTNGTTSSGSITYNGEMTPRLKLTAVPYAMRASAANQLQTSSGANNATLSIAAPTSGNQSFVIQDQGAGGTYNILTEHNGATFLGSSFIQNQNTAQQTTSNFWISGLGRADTSVLTPLIDTATATALNIGTTNATSINLQKDTVVAAGKTITLTGGNTASRPASPTEGMLYYDTSTKQLLTYANGKWQGDRTTSTKIVAASNSSQTEKDAADYVATGTGDQAQINAALTAAAGGKVYLMEGTYTVNASISVPNNTTLAGAGAGTVITIPNGLNVSINAITNADTSTGTRVTIQDLRLEGNASQNAGYDGNGIYLYNMGSGAGSSAVAGSKITGIWAENWTDYGIYLYSSSNNLVSGNNASKNNTGIYVAGNSYNNTLTGNITQGNSVGIGLNANANNNTIVANTTQSNSYAGILVYSSTGNTITGNTAQGNSYGIYLNASSNNTITGNTTQGNSYGIIFTGSSTNTITGNAVAGNTSKGIDLESASDANTISSNNLYNNGNATTNNAIYIDASDSNTISTNTITDTSATTNNFAITISGSGSSNYIAGNTLNSGSINDIGTGTIYGGQLNDSGNYVIQPAGTIELMANTNVMGTISGTSSLTLGTSSTTNGSIIYKNSANANTATIQSGATSTSYSLTLPTALGSTGSCLQDTTGTGVLGWTTCGGAGGANTSLSNLITTNINQPLNATGGNLTLQTTTIGNINLNPVGTIELQKNTNVTGTLTATTSVLTPTLDVASAGTLSIGNATATTVNIATNAAAHTINIGTDATTAQTVTIGSASSTGGTTINAGDGGVRVNSYGSGFIYNYVGGAEKLRLTTSQILGFSDEFVFRNAAGSSTFMFMQESTNSVQVDAARSFQVNGTASFAKGLTIDGAGASLTGLNYTTPLGATLGTVIKVPNYNIPAFGTIFSFGISNCTNPADLTPTCTGSGYTPSTARGILVADARNTAHQATIGILSPDENQIFGLSYDGSNTTARLKNSANTVALQGNGVDLVTAKEVSTVAVVTFGVAGVNEGQLALASSANSNVVTFRAGTQGGSYKLSIPALTGDDTVCTVGLNNCAGTAGATTSLNNLTATNINQALNSTSADLTLQTTTSGNINIAPVGTINLNSNTTVATGKNFTVTSGTTSLTGTTNINTTGAATTSIGTGTGNNSIGNTTGTLGLTGSTVSVLGTTTINTTGTATTSIGNSTGTLQLASNTFNLSSTGAITGATGIGMASGNFLQSGTGSFGTGSGAISLNGAVSAASTIDITGSFATKKGSDYSTTGTTNDVNFGDVSLVRLTGASTQTITGITGGRDGKQLTIINAAGQMAFLSNGSASSLAANRITTGIGADLAIPAAASISLIYDSGASLWRVVGTTATAVPMARAYTTASQSIATGTTRTMINLEQEDIDNNSMHDTVTNNSRLVVTTAGVYKISGTIGLNDVNTTGNRFAEIFLNGNTTPIAASAIAGTGSSSYTIVNVGITKYLNVGDYITIGVDQYSGSSMTLIGGSTYDYLEMYRIDGGMTNPPVGGSGVSVVGGLDGGTRNATGATISGSNIYLQSAGTDFAGLMNTTTQSLAGAKTFTGNLVASAGITTSTINSTSADLTLQTTTSGNINIAPVGTINLNSNTTVATGKNFTVTNGTTALTGTTNINTSGAAVTSIGTGTGNNSIGNTTGTLGLTGSTVSVLGTTTINTTGTLATSIGSNTAGAVSITSNAASNFTTNAGLLTLQGKGGVTIASTGGTTSSDITISTGNASSGAAGNVSIDTGTFTSGTPTVSIGTARAAAVNIGQTTTTVTIQGNLTAGSTAGTGTFTNNGATKNTTLALGDLAAGAIGTAANTVDKYTSFTISPTASGRTYSVPAPTDGAAGRIIYMSNVNATNTFIVGSTTFNTHTTATLVYDGTGWNFILADSSGSGSYIQNQTGVTQGAAFKINGAGTLGGLLTASAGATITGTTNINTTGAAVTSIGTGTGNNSIGNTTGTLGLTGSTVSVLGTTTINTTGTATTSIGNSTGTLQLASNTFNLSTTGAITGATGIGMASGNFLQSGTGSFGTGSGAVSLNGAVSASSTIDVTGSFATKKGSDYSTTGSSNDVNFGDVSLVRLTGASTQTITGITGGRDGEQLTIINAAGQMAMLANNSASSSAANRITTGISADLGIPAAASISLIYDSGASLWRVIGTTPTAVPMVKAYVGSAQSIPNGVWSIIALNQEEYDNNNQHDNVTNNSRLTAQTAGYYHIVGRVGYVVNATSGRYAGLFMNGTAGVGGTGTQLADTSSQGITSGANTIVSVSTTKYLNAGDYIELEAWQLSGGALNTTGAAYENAFEMYRIDGGMTNPVIGNSYIQNQTASAQSASFNISGTGQISSGSSVGLTIQSSSQGIRMQSGTRATFVDSANSNMWNIDNFTGGTFRIFREDYNSSGTGANGVNVLSMDGVGTTAFNGSSTVQNSINLMVAGSYISTWLAQASGNTSINSGGSGTLGLNSGSGGSVVVGRSQDFLLAADSGTPNNSGDVIFTNSALSERARIWSDPTDINVIHIRANSSANATNISNVASCNIGYGTGSTSCSSDQRLKDNITATTDNLAKVMQLQPVSYTWKSQAANPKTRVGLIAQNVLQAFPEAIDVDANGYYTLDYSSLVSPLIGAVQEQQAQIDTMKTSITALQGTNLKNGGTINGSIAISGNLSVTGSVTIAGDVHTGDIYIGGHLASKGATPTVVVGSALGAGAGGGIGDPVVSADGTDTAGTITITAGTQGVLSGVLTHVDFDKDYVGNYKVVISASNDHAADLRLYTANKTATGFDVVSNAAVAAGQQYQIDYIIVATSAP